MQTQSLKMWCLKGFIGALSTLSALSAEAHVVLTQKSAPVGGYFRAQFMVGHGCEGSATVAVQVDLPDGVPVARPQPKSGWTLSYETGPLAEPANVHGKMKTEGIRRVIWRGGPLPDEQYDEFTLLVFLAKPGEQRFRVLQTCQTGQNDWAEAYSGSGPKPTFPAPLLTVTPAVEAAPVPTDDSGATHQHHHH